MEIFVQEISVGSAETQKLLMLCLLIIATVQKYRKQTITNKWLISHQDILFAMNRVKSSTTILTNINTKIFYIEGTWKLTGDCGALKAWVIKVRFKGSCFVGRKIFPAF